MYTARIENSSGQMLTLTQNESEFQVVSIKGLNPPPAQINTTSIAGLDGAKFNSSKLDTRNVVLTIKINGNVEENRLLLYQMFRTKESCVFYYSNNSLDVSIDGYIETVECDLFSNNEMMQISIVCPYPYFKNIDEIIADISNEVGSFTFPFSINIGDPIPFSVYTSNRITEVINNSESQTGIIIEIYILNSVNKIQIKNTNSGDSLILQYNFLTGDKITINTNKGSKSIRLLRDGANINIFSALQQGSVFLQLAVGVNPFGYLVDNGENDNDVSIKFNYSTIYRGV